MEQDGRSQQASPRDRIRVLVTGGGTIAPIDAVRQIRNVSTGRFSAEITESLLDQGAEVWHIAAPGALLPFQRQATFDLEADDLENERNRLEALWSHYRQVAPRLHLVRLVDGTVAEYAQAVRAILTEQAIDLALFAMAVSDYEPVPSAHKIASDEPELLIRCHRTPKVIQSVREWAPSAFLVGFKLMVDVPLTHLINTARQACVVNQTDLTVANDWNTLRAGRHTVYLVDAQGQAAPIAYPPAPGLVEQLLTRVTQRRA